MKNIIRATETTSQAIDQIHVLASNEAKLVEEANRTIEAIAAATEKAVSFTQEAAASTEEQTSSLQLTFESIKKLVLMAEEVQHIVNGFVQKFTMKDEMKNLLKESIEILEELSQKEEIKSMEEKEIGTLLLESYEKQKKFEVLSVIDKDANTNTLLIEGEKEKKQHNVAHRPYFIEAIKGRDYISEPYISLLTNTYCITIAKPIKRLEGDIIGILVGDISLER